jgi:large subunit ribosomal protein L21
LIVEKISAEVGEVIVLDNVLLSIDGANSTINPKVKVAAEVLEQKKTDKVIVFKKKRRHNYRRKNGHRQQVTVLRVKEIGEAVKAAPAPEKKAEAPKAAAAKTPKSAKTGEAKPAAKKPAAKKAETSEKPEAKKSPAKAKAKAE